MLEWKIRLQSWSDFAKDVGSVPREALDEMAVLLMQRTSLNIDEVETLEEFAARMRAQLLSK